MEFVDTTMALGTAPHAIVTGSTIERLTILFAGRHRHGDQRDRSLLSGRKGNAADRNCVRYGRQTDDQGSGRRA